MISIIIPVYNDEENLLACVESLLTQDINKPYEILVVEDGSHSNLKNKLKPIKKIRYFWQSNGGPGSARNFGLKRAKGEIIVFIDSDCVAPEYWLKTLTDSLISEKVGGVGGKIINFNKGLMSETLHKIEFTDFIKNKRRKTTQVPTASACYFKKDLLDINGFDTSLFFGEDLDLSWRLTQKGKKIIYNPKIWVHHKTSKNLSKCLKKMYILGQAVYRTRVKHPDLEFGWLVKNTFLLLSIFLLLPFISSTRVILKSPELNMIKKIKFFFIIVLFYIPFWYAILVERWKKW